MSARHVRYQLLAAATLLIGLVPVPLAWAIGEPAQLAGGYFGWGLGVELAAAGGTIIAATTFKPGDLQRPGWFLLAASYLSFAALLLFVGPRPAGLYQAPPSSGWAIFTANVAWSVFAVAGFVVLSRAWRGSGLDLSSPAARVVSRAVALGLALLLAGPDLVERFPVALTGDPVAIADCFTDVLDGALFVVAVPVMRAALALGGGLVAWPWVLLTASVAAWLGYDAVAVYGDAAGLDGRTVRIAEEVFKCLGAACTLTAGMAQRWVMTDAAER